MKSMWVLIGLGVFALVVGGCVWGSYNGMVTGRNSADEAWGNIEAAYQRRLDTIPNFAKNAKFSADFQLRLATKYAEARQSVKDAAATRDPNTLQRAADSAREALVIAITAEAVPEAKVDQLTELNAQIENVERVINHERTAYNKVCKNYRDKVQTLPGNMVAGTFGFSASYCDIFKAAEGADRSPDYDLE